LEGGHLGFVSLPYSLKRFGKFLSQAFISFILIGKGFKHFFQYFIDLVGEGYPVEETLLVGPWFSWFVLIRQGTTSLDALVSHSNP